MSLGAATFASMSLKHSLRQHCRSLLPIKPGESGQTTASLPSSWHCSRMILSVSLDVFSVVMTSIPRIICAGFIKCIPITLSCLLVAEAISVMDNWDVLEARIVCGGHIESRFLKMSLLTCISSAAASITRSASLAASARLAVPLIRDIMALASASVVFPR